MPACPSAWSAAGLLFPANSEVTCHCPLAIPTLPPAMTPIVPLGLCRKCAVWSLVGPVSGEGSELGPVDVCASLPGAGERHSTRDKGHEEGGSAYAKAGSSLGSAPGYSRASTPKKPESAYFIALCSHLWLYWGLSPTTISLSLSKS